MGKMREIATAKTEPASPAQQGEGVCHICGEKLTKSIKVHIPEDREFPPLVPICQKCAGNYQHTADAWEDKHGKEGSHEEL